MTLLLREVTALVAGAAVWLFAVVLIAAVPAFLVAVARRRRRSGRHLRWAVAGGLLTAGVCSRLGLSDPLGVALMRRPLPVTWVLAGAVVGTLVVALRPHGVALSDRAAG